MRVSQAMPSQVSLAQLTTGNRTVEAKPEPVTLEVPVVARKISDPKTPIITISSAIPDIKPLSPINTEGLTVDNNNRPTVITRDVHNKKKLLHRSQSTPSSGGDAQSKV